MAKLFMKGREMYLIKENHWIIKFPNTDQAVRTMIHLIREEETVKVVDNKIIHNGQCVYNQGDHSVDLGSYKYYISDVIPEGMTLWNKTQKKT